MNGNARKKLYRLLVQGYGPFCRICSVSDQEYQLVIDHIDNDNANNSSNNLQLLCRRCNYLKNPRRPDDLCVRDERDLTRPIMRLKNDKEHEFREFVKEEINKKEIIPYRDLLNAGAEYMDISPITSKRYLDKMCSSVGYLIKKNGNVKFKPEHPLIITNPRKELSSEELLQQSERAIESPFDGFKKIQ
ncbi:MAG: HNH endonuclease signature motif containing protein [Nitrososphaeraceae archaeon]